MKGAAAHSAPKGVLPLPPALLRAHESTIGKSVAQWKEKKRVPPVLLLSGPRGIGKREIAHWISQLLQCERAGFSEPQEVSLFGGIGGGDLGLDGGSAGRSTSVGSTTYAASPCGICPACERSLHGNAIDFEEIELEKDSQTLKIDQFRAIKETQGFSSFSGSYRIFLIRDAERMTTQAANSILKLLEEPPQGWVFLLTCSDPSSLPSTVLSRCQILRMKPIEDRELREILVTTKSESITDAKRVDAAVRAAQGSLSTALSYLDDENWEKREAILQFLDRPQAHLSALVDWGSGEPDRFRILLDQMERILSDCLLHLQNPSATWADPLSRPTLEKHLDRVVKKLGSRESASAFFLARVERVFSLRREMLAPLNSKILIQDLLIPWLDATA